MQEAQEARDDGERRLELARRQHEKARVRVVEAVKVRAVGSKPCKRICDGPPPPSFGRGHAVTVGVQKLHFGGTEHCTLVEGVAAAARHAISKLLLLIRRGGGECCAMALMLRHVTKRATCLHHGLGHVCICKHAVRRKTREEHSRSAGAIGNMNVAIEDCSGTDGSHA